MWPTFLIPYLLLLGCGRLPASAPSAFQPLHRLMQDTGAALRFQGRSTMSPVSACPVPFPSMSVLGRPSDGSPSSMALSCGPCASAICPHGRQSCISKQFFWADLEGLGSPILRLLLQAWSLRGRQWQGPGMSSLWGTTSFSSGASEMQSHSRMLPPHFWGFHEPRDSSWPGWAP